MSIREERKIEAIQRAEQRKTERKQRALELGTLKVEKAREVREVLKCHELARAAHWEKFTNERFESVQSAKKQI